jgi:hypothetical protein
MYVHVERLCDVSSEGEIANKGVELAATYLAASMGSSYTDDKRYS